MLARFFIKIALAFRSKTCWTIAAFLAAQLPQIRNQVPPKWQGLIDVALAVLAMYFRLNPSATLNNSLEVVSEKE